MFEGLFLAQDVGPTTPNTWPTGREPERHCPGWCEGFGASWLGSADVTKARGPKGGTWIPRAYVRRGRFKSYSPWRIQSYGELHHVT